MEKSSLTKQDVLQLIKQLQQKTINLPDINISKFANTFRIYLTHAKNPNLNSISSHLQQLIEKSSSMSPQNVQRFKKDIGRFIFYIEPFQILYRKDDNFDPRLLEDINYIEDLYLYILRFYKKFSVIERILETKDPNLIEFKETFDKLLDKFISHIDLILFDEQMGFSLGQTLRENIKGTLVNVLRSLLDMIDKLNQDFLIDVRTTKRLKILLNLFNVLQIDSFLQDPRTLLSRVQLHERIFQKIIENMEMKLDLSKDTNRKILEKYKEMANLFHEIMIQLSKNVDRIITSSNKNLLLKRLTGLSNDIEFLSKEIINVGESSFFPEKYIQELEHYYSKRESFFHRLIQQEIAQQKQKIQLEKKKLEQEKKIRARLELIPDFVFQITSIKSSQHTNLCESIILYFRNTILQNVFLNQSFLVDFNPNQRFVYDLLFFLALSRFILKNNLLAELTDVFKQQIQYGIDNLWLLYFTQRDNLLSNTNHNIFEKQQHKKKQQKISKILQNFKEFLNSDFLCKLLFSSDESKLETYKNQLTKKFIDYLNGIIQLLLDDLTIDYFSALSQFCDKSIPYQSPHSFKEFVEAFSFHLADIIGQEEHLEQKRLLFVNSLTKELLPELQKLIVFEKKIIQIAKKVPQPHLILLVEKFKEIMGLYRQMFSSVFVDLSKKKNPELFDKYTNLVKSYTENIRDKIEILERLLKPKLKSRMSPIETIPITKKQEKSHAKIAQQIQTILDTLGLEDSPARQKRHSRPSSNVVRQGMMAFGGGGEDVPKTPVLPIQKQQQTALHLPVLRIRQTIPQQTIPLTRFQHAPTRTKEQTQQQSQLRNMKLRDIKNNNIEIVLSNIQRLDLPTIIWNKGKKKDLICIVDLLNVFGGNYRRVKSLQQDDPEGVISKIRFNHDYRNLIEGKSVYFVIVNQGDITPSKPRELVKIIETTDNFMIIEVACRYKKRDCFKSNAPNPMDDFTVKVLEKALHDMKEQFTLHDRNIAGDLEDWYERATQLMKNPFMKLRVPQEQLNLYRKIQRDKEAILKKKYPDIQILSEDQYRDFK